MRSVSALTLAAGLACTAPPPPPAARDTPAAAPTTVPPVTAPQTFVELDAAGRRAVCTRMFEAERSRCEAVFRADDPPLIERCADEHPMWKCPQIRLADHARCVSDKDPAACAAVDQQKEACGVAAALQQCRLSVELLHPHGPASAAGIAVGDVLLAIDGAPVGLADRERIDALTGTGEPVKLSLVRIGNPVREVEVVPTGDPPLLGATFGAAAACRGWAPQFHRMACSTRNPSAAK